MKLLLGSKTSQTMCASGRIPGPINCTKEYFAVCGIYNPAYFTCPTPPCGITYGNKCMACAANNGVEFEAIGYNDGACGPNVNEPVPILVVDPLPPAPIVNVCSKNRQIDQEIACTTDVRPVCGIFGPKSGINCIAPPCGRTYSNSCQACRDNDKKNFLVDTWTEGECGKNVNPPTKPPVIGQPIACKKGRQLGPAICPKHVDPVCGLFNPQFAVCKMQPCGQTYNNVCEACSANDGKIFEVNSFTRGPCGGTTQLPTYPVPAGGKACPARDSKFNQVAKCSSEVDKVCGYHYPDLIQCFVPPCARTYDNWCQACVDTHHTGALLNGFTMPGECPKIKKDTQLREPCVPK